LNYLKIGNGQWRYIGGKSLFIYLKLSFVRYRIWDFWSLAWMRYPGMLRLILVAFKG
jgi:hypothetical protein